MRGRGKYGRHVFGLLLLLEHQLIFSQSDFTPARAGDELRDFVADFADISFHVFCKEQDLRNITKVLSECDFTIMAQA